MVGIVLEDGSVTLPNIRIPITFQFIVDNTDGTDKIKTRIHKAIAIGIRSCLKDCITDIIEVIVPESIYGDYPGPRKLKSGKMTKGYQSEALMETFIDMLEKQYRDLMRGSRGLREEYFIKQEWKASYAEYVNEMVGVNWSKPGSQGKFIETIDKWLRENLCSYIDKELNKIDPTLTLMYQVV